MQGGRAQELTGQVGERGIARGEESKCIDGCGEPQTADSKEGRETILKKDVQEVLGCTGLLAQIFDLSEPVETIGLQPNTFMEVSRRRTLTEPLSGLRDQLCRNIFIVVQDPPLTEQRGKAWRIFDVLGDRLVFAVADIDQSVCNPKHFLPIRRSLDQDDEIDVAVGRHGAPGAGADENDAHQVAATFRAYVFYSDGQGIVVSGRSYRRRQLRRFGNVEQLSIQLLGGRKGR